ncbi:cell division protein FtsA [Clostridium botulinum]|uniref:Cell division protein FtsA n=1 Tax=Clostridium botulinum C/D str. DC5 TaxID=1443128 RepID=A0A0A0IK38_CLOBO|nr:cell division protein FtsA [Clostridium botulinum]KEI01495.1 cell division protein FtsA [Clostridium botulinum C/D str. BKT75002]KEI07829.1 cell division protein FtsA [Clostridium botulinum C/D str. BKT2873]KGM94882.1 cell division protein FtsA [Clostridium botulinum D str. CCUG 7971]KGN01273.1 cell division protein FtsA [Clostridium botulinum C/D str. DC5]KOC49568.1 cell division protein FtsA [Clostridium botulinum]
MHEYIVGLDIGSSSVYGAVGKVVSNGEIRIVGITSVKCKGLNKSVVVDIDSTSQSIKECITNLERMVDINISEVYVSLPAGVSELIWNKGIVAVASDDKEITENDVMRVIEAAKIVSIPSDKEIIGVVPQQYIVDGYDNIIEPVGMSGMRLEVDAQIVMAQSTIINNLRKSINKAGVRILGEVLQQQAISQTICKREELDMGIAFVDVGAQTTDISIYKRGNLCYTNMVPLGGDNITNDIAICLKLPFPEAEKIKIKYGNLGYNNNDKNVKINVNAGYDNSREIDVEFLKRIIEARSEEILYYVKEELQQSKYYDEISGIVIVGGGLALFKDINSFATDILHKSTRIGFPIYTGATSPIYATVVGVIEDVISTLKINKNIEEVERHINSNSKLKESNTNKKGEGNFVSKIREFFTEFF